MKKISLVLITIASTLFANAQDHNAEMKAWMDYMTPGSIHQKMAKDVGEWKAEVTTWMDPSQPPEKSQATVRNEMAYGGRYLITKYTGTMMGMPFEGMGTMGYDNATKMFNSTWVDNMGTGISYMQGKWKEEGKIIELHGESPDPVTGKMYKLREVMIFNDDNHQTMEIYADRGGKEVKMMEMHLSR
jgi:hypothetical protein